MSILYSLPDADARLLEYDLRDIEATIRAAVEACTPLLEERPELPSMYGKRCKMNRNVGFFANPSDSYGYFYSKQLSKAQPPPAALARLFELARDRFGISINGALVNQYESGDDYISDHSDDERGIDPLGGVVAISWGAERTFRLRRKENKERVHDATTKHCHALVMSGRDFQSRLTHGVPMTKRVREQRVSITFRVHDKAQEQPLYEAWVRAQSKKRGRECE